MWAQNLLILPVVCFWEGSLYSFNFSFQDVETSHLGWVESELDIEGNHRHCFDKTKLDKIFLTLISLCNTRYDDYLSAIV